MRKGNKEGKKKSLILAGKLRTKKMRGIKVRITISLGDRTRSGTFFSKKYLKNKSAAFISVASE